MMRPANGNGTPLRSVAALGTRKNGGRAIEWRNYNTLECYLRDFGHHQLTPEAQARLCDKIRYRCWRPEERERARDLLVRAHIGLVVSLAQEMRVPFVRQLDAIQEGVIGLLRALETFDPNRSRLSTYARYWIRHYMIQYLAANNHIIGRSSEAGLAIRGMREITQAYISEHGTEPSDETLIALLRQRYECVEKYSDDTLMTIRGIGHYPPFRFIDDEDNAEGTRPFGGKRLTTQAVDMADRLTHHRLRAAIDEELAIMARSPSRHAARNVAVFRARFNFLLPPQPHARPTTEEVSATFVMSPMRVRQVIDKVGQRLINRLVMRRLIDPEDAPEAFAIQWNQY